MENGSGDSWHDLVKIDDLVGVNGVDGKNGKME